MEARGKNGLRTLRTSVPLERVCWRLFTVLELRQTLREAERNCLANIVYLPAAQEELKKWEWFEKKKWLNFSRKGNSTQKAQKSSKKF